MPKDRHAVYVRQVWCVYCSSRCRLRARICRQSDPQSDKDTETTDHPFIDNRRCHAIYVALPNNLQYEICTMWELLDLTLTLQLTLILKP